MLSGLWSNILLTVVKNRPGFGKVPLFKPRNQRSLQASRMNLSRTFHTEVIISECELVTFLGGKLNESTTEANKVILSLIIIIICLLITSISNALVIFAVKTKPRLKTMSNFALACLATSDCVMGVIGQPFFTVELAVLLQYGIFGIRP